MCLTSYVWVQGGPHSLKGIIMPWSSKLVRKLKSLKQLDDGNKIYPCYWENKALHAGPHTSDSFNITRYIKYLISQYYFVMLEMLIVLHGMFR